MVGNLYRYGSHLYYIKENTVMAKKDHYVWWNWGEDSHFLKQVLFEKGTLVGKNVQIKQSKTRI